MLCEMAVAFAESTRPLFGGIMVPPWLGRADSRHLTVGEMRLLVRFPRRSHARPDG